MILGGHGLFTWGMTQRECYLNSIHTIDQMGEFILAASGPRKVPCLAEFSHPTRPGSQDHCHSDPSRTSWRSILKPPRRLHIIPTMKML